MNLELTPASLENKNVIKNLMQFYIYDFSEYTGWDVGENGLFRAYSRFDHYWKEGKDRFPYLIKKDDSYVGFVLVRWIKSTQKSYFSVAEFFILKRYRRQGIGKRIARQVFNLHRGQWEVYQKEYNKPAKTFWNRAINEYTGGRFTERSENGKIIQDFENLKLSQ